jgi:hypothetical protein
MIIVDGNGNFALVPGTLKPIESTNPVYNARIALALPVGSWLYAPKSGHQLAIYDTIKATPANQDAYQKSLELYLKPYGPEVLARITGRGMEQLQELITKETISG